MTTAAPPALLTILLAALPILSFLLTLTVFRMKGIHASLVTLAVTLLLTLGAFGLPFNKALGGVLEGYFQGFFPIGYIIIMALWLYKLAVTSGQFKTIQGSIAGLSRDKRVQLLLIGFAFNAFLEGAAGFGVPIAICAVLLTQLGFRPLQAAMLCLIANGASGAFGAIGIPVGIIDSFHLAGVSAHDVARQTALTLPILSFFLPFLLMFILDGWRGVRQVWPATLVTAGTFTLLQVAVTVFMGPELADIIPSLLTMLALAGLLQVWQPAQPMTFDAGGQLVPATHEDDHPETAPHPNLMETIRAWRPFYLLTLFVALWSVPAIKAALAASTFTLPLPGDIAVKVNLLGATGTALLLAALGTIILTPTLNSRNSLEQLRQTGRELLLPILTVCSVLAIAKLTTYGGLNTVLSEAAAQTGRVFPLLSPVLGWIGVFMTGSVVNNNTLFAAIQNSAGQHIGVSGNLLVAANTAGGVIGKLISPQSIAIATAAVQQAGQESTLLSMTLRYSLGLLALVCVWTWLLASFAH